MFKKLVIASAVLAVTTSPAFAGAYKGVYKGEMPCPTYNPPVAPYLGISIGKKTAYANTSEAFQGFVGTLSLGYGGIVSPNWYLAGEVFADGVAKIDDDSASAVSVSSSWDYGVSLIPGYMITSNVLAYLRLGGIDTRFNSSGSNWKWGWQVGLGGQTNVAQNWDLRAEYVYTSNSSPKTGVSRVSTDAVNLGLIYRFA
ncbi:MAG: outer membrane beta-barrel protein [Gammaproteobacteria bacterium]|nr:outer membrane beta-barrel protein [Gammaproteobacteria bacterium]